MPETWIGYHLINEDPLPGDFISIRAIGGGAHTINGVPNEVLYDFGYYNGPAPIKYTVHTNGASTIYIDTIYTSPFDTTYHTIIY